MNVDLTPPMFYSVQCSVITRECQVCRPAVKLSIAVSPPTPLIIDPRRWHGHWKPIDTNLPVCPVPPTPQQVGGMLSCMSWRINDININQQRTLQLISYTSLLKASLCCRMLQSKCSKTLLETLARLQRRLGGIFMLTESTILDFILTVEYFLSVS